ncbi:MAG: hypothetical protein R3E02_15620 [Blastomonas sp.]
MTDPLLRESNASQQSARQRHAFIWQSALPCQFAAMSSRYLLAAPLGLVAALAAWQVQPGDEGCKERKSEWPIPAAVKKAEPNDRKPCKKIIPLLM